MGLEEVLAGILRELPSGDTLLDQVREDRAQGQCGCDVVYPVSDLDGDGRADVVEITIHEASDGSAESTIDVLSSRRGGERLFTDPARVPGYATVVSTRVGRGPGLLYYSVDYRYVPQSYLGELRAGVLTPGGSRVWERSWALPWTWTTLDYQRWLEDLAVIRDGNGVAVGIAIAISESVESGVTLHFESVSTANGQTVAERTTIEDELEEVVITPLALRGKSKHALAVQVNPISGNKESLRVHRSLGEDPLWELMVKEYAWVEGTANLVGGPRNELVLEQGFGKAYAFQVLDSRTGEVEWQSSVAGSIADDAGGDGRSDMLQIRQLGRAKERRWKLTRIELPARVLWTEDVGVRHQYDDYAWTSIDVAPWGDVDEDGVAEVRARMTTETTYDADYDIYLGSERALLDGKSGQTMTQAARYMPLTGSLDGRGSDALTVRVAPDFVEITARDGSDEAILWRRRILMEAPRKLDPCLWAYYVVEGPSSDDVLVVIPRRGGGDEEVLIEGATGNVIWHLDKG